MEVGEGNQRMVDSCTTASKSTNISYRPTGESKQKQSILACRAPTQRSGSLRGLALYKIFVGLFGDCALINAVFGIQHLLY